ncbi:MAG: small-conductance mechanosensitive channel [Sphingobacteriales bacterium]|jgi:small-conductance mechanosensitive channel
MEWIQQLSWSKLSWFIFLAVLLLVVSILVKKWIRKSLPNKDQKYTASRWVNFGFYFGLIVIGLSVFSDQLDKVGMFFGIAGAGIAFALQELIVSLAAWVYLSASGISKVGDRVKIGEVKGDIIDIGIFTTTLMELGDWVSGDLYNGRIVTVANSFVFKEKIHNYSSHYPFLWDEIVIPIAHGSNIEKAEELFGSILAKHQNQERNTAGANWGEMQNLYKIENEKLDPTVSITFDENWISFTLRYITNYKTRRSQKHIISKEILTEIPKINDVRIAWGSSDNSKIKE